MDGNKITISYNDFVQKGTIASTENDTLKIKWAEFDVETKYVKYGSEKLFTILKENGHCPYSELDRGSVIK